MTWGTKHTNTFIPKVIAEARNYELTRNETSRKLSEFFWHTMIDHHTFAPGCSSDKEHYFDPKKLSQHLTGYTGETCCTYNMLKLSRHLFAGRAIHLLRIIMKGHCIITSWDNKTLKQVW